jgi:hypothetical protein
MTFANVLDLCRYDKTQTCPSLKKFMLVISNLRPPRLPWQLTRLPRQLTRLPRQLTRLPRQLTRPSWLRNGMTIGTKRPFSGRSLRWHISLGRRAPCPQIIFPIISESGRSGRYLEGTCWVVGCLRRYLLIFVLDPDH